MFISPKKGIEEGWITGVLDIESQVQPNALDFTLNKVSLINTGDNFVFTDVGKFHRRQDELTPTVVINRNTNDEEPMYEGRKFFHLRPGRKYDFTSHVYVKIPAGYAGFMITRSTLNRNGVYITSGLYDSGFEGHIAGVIHTPALPDEGFGGMLGTLLSSGLTLLQPGVAIGQFIITDSETAKLYSGGYNHVQGTHWTQPESRME